jgi:hypothetical protein
MSKTIFGGRGSSASGGATSVAVAMHPASTQLDLVTHLTVAAVSGTSTPCTVVRRPN